MLLLRLALGRNLGIIIGLRERRLERRLMPLLRLLGLEWGLKGRLVLWAAKGGAEKGVLRELAWGWVLGLGILLPSLAGGRSASVVGGALGVKEVLRGLLLPVLLFSGLLHQLISVGLPRIGPFEQRGLDLEQLAFQLFV